MLYKVSLIESQLSFLAGKGNTSSITSSDASDLGSNRVHAVEDEYWEFLNNGRADLLLKKNYFTSYFYCFVSFELQYNSALLVKFFFDKFSFKIKPGKCYLLHTTIVYFVCFAKTGNKQSAVVSLIAWFSKTFPYSFKKSWNKPYPWTHDNSF